MRCLRRSSRGLLKSLLKRHKKTNTKTHQSQNIYLCFVFVYLFSSCERAVWRSCARTESDSEGRRNAERARRAPRFFVGAPGRSVGRADDSRSTDRGSYAIRANICINPSTQFLAQQNPRNFRELCQFCLFCLFC